MDLTSQLRDRDRLTRTVLAAALTTVAVRSFRRGKRGTGALAGVAAAALGYELTTEVAGETADIATSTERGGLRCSVCGEPIVPGQRRTPSDAGGVAHEDCLDVPQ